MLPKSCSTFSLSPAQLLNRSTNIQCNQPPPARMPRGRSPADGAVGDLASAERPTLLDMKSSMKCSSTVSSESGPTLGSQSVPSVDCDDCDQSRSRFKPQATIIFKCSSRHMHGRSCAVRPPGRRSQLSVRTSSSTTRTPGPGPPPTSPPPSGSAAAATPQPSTRSLIAGSLAAAAAAASAFPAGCEA
jgi:hypothetical protein